MPVADGPNWADVMQGIGGIAAVPALLLTLYVITRESRIRREEKADADAAHARLVLPHAFAVDQESRYVPEEGRYVGEGPIYGVYWTVTNYGPEPITGVWVKVVGDFVGDGLPIEFIAQPMPPGDTQEGKVALVEPVELPQSDIPSRYMFPVRVGFSDARGRWVRDGNTEPRRVHLADAFALAPMDSGKRRAARRLVAAAFASSLFGIALAGYGVYLAI